MLDEDTLDDDGSSLINAILSGGLGVPLLRSSSDSIGLRQQVFCVHIAKMVREGSENREARQG